MPLPATRVWVIDFGGPEVWGARGQAGLKRRLGGYHSLTCRLETQCVLFLGNYRFGRG